MTTTEQRPVRLPPGSSPDETPPETDFERCADYERSVGRCQLLTGHGGPHAISVDAAFITWDSDATSQWVKAKPPGWLVNLAWAPGYQPTLYSDRRYAPGAVDISATHARYPHW
jgi:hypothetical protein